MRCQAISLFMQIIHPLALFHIQYRSNATSHLHDTFSRLYWSTQAINVCDSRENRQSSKRYSIEIVSQVLIARYIVISHGQSCCHGGHVAVLLGCQIEILRVSVYSNTSCTFIFSQHCHSTFTNISIINTQASNINPNT